MSEPEWQLRFKGGMPVTFREHRGTLEESLKTAVPLTGLFQLPLHLSALLGLRVTLSDIEISHYGYDDRIAKDLYMVKVTGRNVGPIVMGFLDVEL